jgi:hypothetical protein
MWDAAVRAAERAPGIFQEGTKPRVYLIEALMKGDSEMLKAALEQRREEGENMARFQVAFMEEVTR